MKIHSMSHSVTLVQFLKTLHNDSSSRFAYVPRDIMGIITPFILGVDTGLGAERKFKKLDLQIPPTTIESTANEKYFCLFSIAAVIGGVALFCLSIPFASLDPLGLGLGCALALIVYGIRIACNSLTHTSSRLKLIQLEPLTKNTTVLIKFLQKEMTEVIVKVDVVKWKIDETNCNEENYKEAIHSFKSSIQHVKACIAEFHTIIENNNEFLEPSVKGLSQALSMLEKEWISQAEVYANTLTKDYSELTHEDFRLLAVNFSSLKFWIGKDLIWIKNCENRVMEEKQRLSSHAIETLSRSMLF